MRPGDVKGFVGLILGGLLLGVNHAGAEDGTAAPSGEPAARSSRAQQTAVKIFKYTDRSGVTSFSDRAPSDARYEVIRYTLTCYACNPRSTVDWHSTPLHLAAFRETIDAAAGKYGVDPALVRAVIHAESAFRPDAVSKKGAQGLMQLMPGTARELGVVDAMSPEQNIHGGVRYLASLLARSGGNTTLATAAYNAGPGAVERFDGIPPYEETQTYVRRVRILHARYRDALEGVLPDNRVSQAGSY
jgi:soluble lytic murein transglycosylase-like protein